MKEKLSILKEALGSYYKSREEDLFVCPFCKHHKKKLSVNLTLGVYKCWVCDSKGKSLHRLIKRFDHRHLAAKWNELDGQLDMSEVGEFFQTKEDHEEKQLLSHPDCRVELHICLALLFSDTHKRRAEVGPPPFSLIGHRHQRPLLRPLPCRL